MRPCRTTRCAIHTCRVGFITQRPLLYTLRFFSQLTPSVPKGLTTIPEGCLDAEAPIEGSRGLLPPVVPFTNHCSDSCETYANHSSPTVALEFHRGEVVLRVSPSTGIRWQKMHPRIAAACFVKAVADRTARQAILKSRCTRLSEVTATEDDDERRWGIFRGTTKHVAGASSGLRYCSCSSSDVTVACLSRRVRGVDTLEYMARNDLTTREAV